MEKELQCLPLDIFLHQDLLEEVICFIGQGVLYDPVVLPCSHRFCRNCISIWLESHSNCPVCKCDSRIQDIKSDDGVWRIIKSFKTRCGNQQCKWEGRYSERQNHIEKYCEFQQICCDYDCGSYMMRKELDEHKKICDNRRITCKDCGLEIRKIKWEQHENECLNKIIICTNNCGKMFARRFLDDHLEKECELRNINCKYFVTGCTFKGKQQELLEHYKNNTEMHLDMTFKAFLNLKEHADYLEGLQNENHFIPKIANESSSSNSSKDVICEKNIIEEDKNIKIIDSNKKSSTLKPISVNRTPEPGFFWYMADRREKLIYEQPDLTTTQQTEKMEEEWQKMSSDDRKKYIKHTRKHEVQKAEEICCKNNDKQNNEKIQCNPQ